MNPTNYAKEAVWKVFRIGVLVIILATGLAWAYRYLLTMGAARRTEGNVTFSFVPPENPLNPEFVWAEEEKREYVYFPWQEEEYVFIGKAMSFGLEAIQSSQVTACIANLARAYPAVHVLPTERPNWREEVGYWSNVLHFLPERSAYQDLYAIHARPHHLVLYKMKESSPNRYIATAGTSRMGVVLRSRGVNMPLPIYLSAHYLDQSLASGDYRDYGATLVHEILHHYNHDHPDEGQELSLFIRAATRCVAKYRPDS